MSKGNGDKFIDKASDAAHDVVDKVDELVGSNTNDSGVNRKKAAGEAHKAVEGAKEGAKDLADKADKKLNK